MHADHPRGYPDIVSTGWIRVLPEPAFNAYGAIVQLESAGVSGDLDQLGAEVFNVAGIGGLDGAYVASVVVGEDEEAAANSSRRWEEFGVQAARYGMPMRTARDAIAFMRRIGLVTRAEESGRVFWRTVVPVPLIEDVLELDEATRAHEADLRWRIALMQTSNAIVQWLREQRTEAPTTEVRTTLEVLAAELELDVEEARHGLDSAVTESGDIATRPDHLRVPAGEAIEIVVDWKRFDAERITIYFEPD